MRQNNVKLVSGLNGASGGPKCQSKRGANTIAKNITAEKRETPVVSVRKVSTSIGLTKKPSTPDAVDTTETTRKKSLLANAPMHLAEKLPVIFANSNLNSPEGKLAQLNLLDDTLMNLSLVADSLQKRASRDGGLDEKETVQALCQVSKEIRSIVQVKLEIRKRICQTRNSKNKISNATRTPNAGA